MRNDRYLYTAQLKAGDETEHKIHLYWYKVQNVHQFINNF